MFGWLVFILACNEEIMYLLQSVSFLLSALEDTHMFSFSINNGFRGVMALRVQLAVSVPAEWHLHLHPASRGNANSHAASGTKFSIFMLKSLLIKSQLH